MYENKLESFQVNETVFNTWMVLNTHVATHLRSSAAL